MLIFIHIQGRDPRFSQSIERFIFFRENILIFLSSFIGGCPHLPRWEEKKYLLRTEIVPAYDALYFFAGKISSVIVFFFSQTLCWLLWENKKIYICCEPRLSQRIIIIIFYRENIPIKTKRPQQSAYRPLVYYEGAKKSSTFFHTL